MYAGSWPVCMMAVLITLLLHTCIANKALHLKSNRGWQFIHVHTQPGDAAVSIVRRERSASTAVTPPIPLLTVTKPSTA